MYLKFFGFVKIVWTYNLRTLTSLLLERPDKLDWQQKSESSYQVVWLSKLILIYTLPTYMCLKYVSCGVNQINPLDRAVWDSPGIIVGKQEAHGSQSSLELKFQVTTPAFWTGVMVHAF